MEQRALKPDSVRQPSQCRLNLIALFGLQAGLNVGIAGGFKQPSDDLSGRGIDT